MTTQMLLDRGRRGAPLTDLDVVDMHGHLGEWQFTIPDRSNESVVAVMDRVGVRQVIVSHMRCIAGGMEFGNSEVLAAIRAHPGRILGYVIFWPSSPQAVEAQAKKYLAEEGFVGLKLYNAIGFSYTDAAYVPALEIANARRMPVLLHTWAEPPMFEQVRQNAARYPEISFILAHSTAQLPEEDYVKVARELPNVYLDLCASRTPPGKVERMVEAVGVDKFVWGSDIYFINLAHQIGKVLGAKLSDADKKKILSANARRILGRIVH